MAMEQLNIHEITKSSFQIENTLRLNNKSKFGDTLWDFTGEKNIRNNSIDNAKFKFNWNNIENKIGPGFIWDLKCIVFFLIKAPSIFSGKLGKNSGYKVNSVQGKIMSFVNALEYVVRFHQIETEDKGLDTITNFSNLKLSHFEKVKISETSLNSVKKILRLLAHPISEKHVIHNVNWKQQDVDNIIFITFKKSNIKERSTKSLDEKLFIELSKQITVDIISFKKMMNIEIYSKIPESYIKELESEIQFNNLSEIFADYVTIREVERDKSLEFGKRNSYSSNKKKEFKKKFNLSIKEFNEYLIRIQQSSILAVALFTGVRYSELISFKHNCILKRGDVYLLKGTISKHRNELLPTDLDEWVAIPIVRDAVEILQEMQRISFNSYLVSSLFSVYLNKKDLPISLTALTESFKSYIKTVSRNNNELLSFVGMKEHALSTQRIRHTLALNLIRGRLGIPFISYHLKHVNTAVVAYKKASNVTLGYGGISKEIYHSAKYTHQAKNELLNEIYNPISPLAGGENANEFKRRRKEFFQGLSVNDEEIEETIESLKDQSLPFLDVGLGYCGGRKDILQEDGSKKPPPCIGQLKCNPVDCGNAIIPKSKLPIWKKMYQDTYTKLEDEEYAYMRVELKEELRRAEYVINQFR